MNVKITTEESGYFDTCIEGKNINFSFNKELHVVFNSKEYTGEDEDTIQIDVYPDDDYSVSYIPLSRNEAYLLANTLLTMLKCPTE